MSWCCTWFDSNFDRPLLSVDFFIGKSNWLCAPCSSRATQWPPWGSDWGGWDF